MNVTKMAENVGSGFGSHVLAVNYERKNHFEHTVLSSSCSKL